MTQPTNPAFNRHNLELELKMSLHTADEYAKHQVGLEDKDQGGACGFAWVKIKGIRKDAIKKALLDYGFTRSYPNGLELWIHKYGQSVDVKSNYAMYFAKFMREQTGLPFTSGSRLD